MSRPANTRPQVLLPEESIPKPCSPGRIPALRRTVVRVSTRFGLKQSIRAAGQCRFATRARRATGFAAVELLSNRLQRTSHSENPGFIQSRLRWRTNVNKKSPRQDGVETLGIPVRLRILLMPLLVSIPLFQSGLAQSASGIRPSEQFHKKNSLIPFLRGSLTFHQILIDSNHHIPLK